MVAAVGDLLDGGRIKLYCAPSFDRDSWTRDDLSLEERARRHGDYEWWVLTRLSVHPAPTRGTHELRRDRSAAASAPSTPPTSASSAPT
jgi:esterase/lipase superfamily enzyme